MGSLVGTFPRIGEFEKAKALADSLPLAYQVVAPEPGLTRVGVPALVLDDQARAAGMAHGHAGGRRMKEAAIRISLEEQMRMKAIVLDEDRDDALELVKQLLQRVEAAQNLGVRSHLDS